jgi:GMP synthase PP-ATPase subunit
VYFFREEQRDTILSNRGLLKGTSDPEGKRKIISSTFVEIFEGEAKQTVGNY